MLAGCAAGLLALLASLHCWQICRQAAITPAPSMPLHPEHLSPRTGLQYVHMDGGKYRGEWLGMLKQGYGVYTYPSGAKYEGG